MPQTDCPLDVVVVGAGLGGLAAAVASRLSGHNVTVYESARELREVSQNSTKKHTYTHQPQTHTCRIRHGPFLDDDELTLCVFRAQVGAGLQVTPNATKILHGWDMPSTLWQSVAEPTSLVVHRYNGQILAQQDHFDTQMQEKYNAPFLDIHRVDLQRALVQKAEKLGVTVKLGERVDAIELDHRTEITCVPSGHQASCDLIVAADGLWSRCRALYTSSDKPPLPTGDLAYRIVLDLDVITDPELRSWVENPTVHFWIGPGAHAVGYSLRGGRAYNIVLLVPDDLSLDATRQQGSVVEMMALFQGWDPILTRFLGMVDSVEKWKLMHRKPSSPRVPSSVLLELCSLKNGPETNLLATCNQAKSCPVGSATSPTLSLCKSTVTREP